jgi:hypothetical protein
MSGDVSSAGSGPMTLSVTLPAETSAETGAGSPAARLAAGGVLDRDGLAALIHLAHVGVRRGCRELVVDVHGLTDFPSALFAELRKLADVAGRRRCRLRLDGLDTAVAAPWTWPVTRGAVTLQGTDQTMCDSGRGVVWVVKRFALSGLVSMAGVRLRQRSRTTSPTAGAWRKPCPEKPVA